MGEARVAGRCGALVAEVGREPLGDEREPALRRELLTGVGERVVQLVDPPAQHRVVEGRPVDGAPGSEGPCRAVSSR